MLPACGSRRSLPRPHYHRYDTQNYFAADPVLGDIAALDALTGVAHAAGIKVILDFVPSHLSVQHPAFIESRTEADSPKRDWFVFYDWPDNYRSFLGAVPDRFLTLHERYMKDAPLLTSFLDNHDMDRFLHTAPQNRQSAIRSGAAMLWCAPTCSAIKPNGIRKSGSSFALSSPFAVHTSILCGACGDVFIWI